MKSYSYTFVRKYAPLVVSVLFFLVMLALFSMMVYIGEGFGGVFLMLIPALIGISTAFYWELNYRKLNLDEISICSLSVSGKSICLEWSSIKMVKYTTNYDPSRGFKGEFWQLVGADEDGKVATIRFDDSIIGYKNLICDIRNKIPLATDRKFDSDWWYVVGPP